MLHITGRAFLSVFLVAGLSGSGLAQSLPTSQPNFLQIFREEVKVGHEADHVKTEAAWPAAFEKAKSPYFSLALVALTGPPEAWFVLPFDSNAAIGDSMKRNDEPAMAAELARLSRADAQHISGLRTIVAAARKDLSRGAFPDTAKQRFYEITVFRVRPGHEDQFQAAAKAFGAAAGRGAPGTSYRVYEVIAGMPSPTYLVFSSVPSFGDFDKMQADGEATMKAASTEERTTLQKFGLEASINTETHRFRLDPEMSYVPKDVRAQDPAFWMPKRPAVTAEAKKATSTP
jgi:hypothetical protein